MNLKIAKIIIFIITLSVTDVFCQSTKEKLKTKKNAISIEFYQPIDNNLFKPFYNFESLIGNDFTVNNNQSRSSFSNGFGISFERINNDIVFRSRLGISITSSDSHIDFEYVYPDEDEKVIVNQNDQYAQNHINLFIGIAKRFHLNERFSLDFGVDFASIYYLKATGEYDYINERIRISDNTLLENQVINVKEKVASSNALGIGPVFKPQYNVFKNVVVSMELQVYFMRTFSNRDSERTETVDHNIFADNFNEHTELDSKINYSINQWNWTKISPLIRIGYQF